MNDRGPVALLRATAEPPAGPWRVSGNQTRRRTPDAQFPNYAVDQKPAGPPVRVRTGRCVHRRLSRPGTFGQTLASAAVGAVQTSWLATAEFVFDNASRLFLTRPR